MDEQLKESLKFNPILYKAVTENDIAFIRKFLHPNYSKLTLEDRELKIFQHACLQFSQSNLGREILHYLIFDYKISEENSLNKENEIDAANGFTANDEVKKMFQIRRLNNELETDLKDCGKFSKRPKI